MKYIFLIFISLVGRTLAQDVVQLSLDNTNVVLDQGSPSFTFWDVKSCSDITQCPSSIFVKLANAYELDPVSGRLLAGRQVTSVFEASKGGWTSKRSPVGTPPVETLQAYYKVPIKPVVPSCNTALNGAVFTQPNAFLVLELFLFKAATNVTTHTQSNSTVIETTEILPGNLKWNVRVDGWPFCSSKNRLVLEFLMRSGQDSDSTGESVEIKTYSQILNEIQSDASTLEEYFAPVLDVEVTPYAYGSSSPAPEASSHDDDTLEESSLPSHAKTSLPSPKPHVLPQVILDTIMGFPDIESTHKQLLIQRYNSSRPVHGFGKRNLTDPGHFIFFPPTLSGQKGREDQCKVDVPGRAVVDNVVKNIDVQAIGVENAPKDVRLKIMVPAFNTNVVYDPVAAISDSQGQVQSSIEDAINQVVGIESAIPTQGIPPPLVEEQSELPNIDAPLVRRSSGACMCSFILSFMALLLIII